MNKPMRVDRKGNPYHPAKYGNEIQEVMTAIIRAEIKRTPPDQEVTVLDPFGGLGGIFAVCQPFVLALQAVVSIEIEPEWADYATKRAAASGGEFYSICDDYFDCPPLGGGGASIICTSPTYGNRMTDDHDPREDSVRNTYKHSLGRDLTEGSSANMQWGDDYRDFHERAWRKVYNDLKPGGLFILNVKDHIRKDEKMPVVAWHRGTLRRIGFTLEQEGKVSAKGHGQGENGKVRVDHEWVMQWRKPR